MPTIRENHPIKILFSAPADRFDVTGGYFFYYRRRRVFTAALLFFGLIGWSGVLAFSNRAALVFFLSSSCFLYLLRSRTKAIAERIKLTRQVRPKAREGEDIEINYELENASAFALTHAFVLDRFTGTKKDTHQWFMESVLAPGGKFVKSEKLSCDAGMGEHKYGPAEITITDALGIFEFTVTEDATAMTIVYPVVGNLPQIKLAGSKDSYMYGLYEVQSRGDSTNFAGVREYAPGDPIKIISWKLAAKHGRLLVKEFEKITNSEISILLDMDGRFHAGEHSESTWEYARELTLGLANQQTMNGNSIQVLSQKGYVPWGRGETHLQYITRCLPDFVPQESRLNLVDTYWPMIPHGSTVILISPVFPGDYSKTLQAMARLSFKNVETLCVLLDGPSFLKSKVYGVLSGLLSLDFQYKDAMLDDYVKRLRLSGTRTVLVKNKDNLGRALLRLEAS